MNINVFCLVVPIFIAPLNLCCAQQPLGFTAGPTIQLPTGATPHDISIADFNHDGRPDLAIPERGLDTLAIYAQTAAGGFLVRPTARYFIPGGPHTTVPIALNGFGPVGSPLPPADELVVGVPNLNYLYFFDNVGTVPGVTALVARPAVQWVPMGPLSQNARLMTAPLNNDLYPDLAFFIDSYSYQSGNRHGVGGMAVYPNSTGTNRLNSTLMYQTNFQPVDFTMAAMVTPGTYDALLASPTTNTVVMAEGGAGSLFSDPWWSTGYQQVFPSYGVRPVAAAGGDVNRDGWPDLVAAHETNPNVVVQLREPTLGQVFFQPNRLTYPLLGTPKQVMLQDLNSDGRPELVVLLANSFIEIFRNTGQNGQALFDAPFIISTGLDPAYMRIADINADGLPDLAVACAGDDTVYLFYNQGSILAMTPVGNAHSVAVYPNPAHAELHLTDDPSFPVQAIELLDATGRCVRRWPPGTASLNVATLPRGLYLLRLESRTRNVVRRVVLE